MSDTPTVAPIARLVLVRHGNTFRDGEAPRRVGGRTDLHLVETGRAEKAARVLQDAGVVPDRVFAAPLHRTMETAEIIIRTLELPLSPVPAAAFSEIDYGPDEDKPEEEVVRRLGKDALEAWDRAAIVPPGWNVDVEGILQNWRAFADGVAPGETVLLVSSNGILRFAPCLLGAGYEAFVAAQKIKVSTGGVCVFENGGFGWTCSVWNSKVIA